MFKIYNVRYALFNGFLNMGANEFKITAQLSIRVVNCLSIFRLSTLTLRSTTGDTFDIPHLFA